MLRRNLLILATLALAACGNTSFDRDLDGVDPPQVRDYDVVGLTIVVPRTLEVSEENAYYPGADIVWRGDPPGDRYEQVEAIFEAGMGRGAQFVDGDRDVQVSIEVRRFHSITEKARYTIGGVHSIRFILTVFDARTGQVIEGPRWVSADLDAFGRGRALQADREGQTQKVRVTAHLARVIQRELGDPSPTFVETQ